MMRPLNGLIFCEKAMFTLSFISYLMGYVLDVGDGRLCSGQTPVYEPAREGSHRLNDTAPGIYWRKAVLSDFGILKGLKAAAKAVSPSNSLNTCSRLVLISCKSKAEPARPKQTSPQISSLRRPKSSRVPGAARQKQQRQR